MFINKKDKQRNFLLLNPEFSNLTAKLPYKSYEKLQNFSSISLNLYQLGQNNPGTWVVNTNTLLHIPHLTGKGIGL